jgi:hypothetical protein
MTVVSRASRRFAPPFLFAIAIAFAAVPAAGQSDTPAGPIRLMPHGTPSVPRSRPLESSPVATKTNSPSSIRVEGLRAIDPDSVGTLGPAAGGLGADMWSGTSRTYIETLLTRLPAKIESPTMRGLARRLLLSVARVPLAKKGNASRTSLIARRVERLRAIGLVEDAGALLAASPARGRDPALLRLSTEQMVIEDNFSGACAEALRDARQGADRNWQRLVVYCQLRDGQNEAAAFGANILAETAGFDDPTFLSLVDRLSGAGDVKVAGISRPTPLHLAMFQQAKLRLPKDVVKTDSPTVLRMVALSQNADDAVRLQAAERAAVLGSLTPAKLGEIYTNMEFPAADIERALSIAEKDRSPRSRALLYRAALAQKVDTARSAVLRKALESGRRAGLTPLTVRLYRPIIEKLPATGVLAWIAGETTRALLTAGAAEAARPWLLLIRQRALRDDEMRRVRDGLWGFAVLAREAGAAANELAAMDAWFASLQETDAKSAAAKAGLALSLMQAVGVFPPEGYHERILALPPGKARGSVAPPGVLQALSSAASRRRRGEAVALALIALGGTKLEDAGVQVLHEVVKGLASVGLTKEAQALALEAASAAGM